MLAPSVPGIWRHQTKTEKKTFVKLKINSRSKWNLHCKTDSQSASLKTAGNTDGWRGIWIVGWHGQAFAWMHATRSLDYNRLWVNCISDTEDNRRFISVSLNLTSDLTSPFLSMCHTTLCHATLVAWYSGRTSVFGRQTFPVLCSTLCG